MWEASCVSRYVRYIIHSINSDFLKGRSCWKFFSCKCTVSEYKLWMSVLWCVHSSIMVLKVSYAPKSLGGFLRVRNPGHLEFQGTSVMKAKNVYFSQVLRWFWCYQFRNTLRTTVLVIKVIKKVRSWELMSIYLCFSEYQQGNFES